MKRSRYTLLAAWLLSSFSTCAGGSSVTNLRIYAISPSHFPYKLMSSMGASEASFQLAFNHRSGSTHIVRVGEALGGYKVRSFEPVSERLFNQTINAYQSRKGGRVVLEDPSGETVALEMGEALTGAGWTACLTDLTTGLWDYVVEGDTLSGDPPLAVVSVDTNAVTVACAGISTDVLWAAAGERESLAALWEARKNAYLAQRAEANEQGPESHGSDVWRGRVFTERQPSRGTYTSSSTSTFFGTDYAYPTDYEVISVLSRTESGQLVNRPLLVPTRFERRGAAGLLSRPRAGGWRRAVITHTGTRVF